MYRCPLQQPQTTGLVRFLRRLAVAGLVLLFGMPAVSAESCRPVTTGKITAARGLHDFNRGLLWKIEKGDARPSYLFGTFHTSDPRITTLPCPVQETFDRASSYTMEVIANGAGIVTMAEAMFFTDGQTLQQLLGESLYRDTLRAVGIDDPARAGGLNNMKPWAVMMTLLSPRESHGLFLDMALQLQATRQGKPTYGLETMQEQIAVFNGMRLDDQVVLLRDAVQTVRMTSDAIEELVQVYLQRDLAALLALQDKYQPADTRVYAEMMRRLLTQRNHNMAERLHERLQEGNAFIAVGALHLPGESGLLQLLNGAGYRLTRVY